MEQETKYINFNTKLKKMRTNHFLQELGTSAVQFSGPIISHPGLFGVRIQSTRPFSQNDRNKK
jgi:hypothetical protein